MLQIGRAKEAPFVVASFRPGVGEIDVEAVYGVVRDRTGQEGGGIGADNPDVCEVPSADAVNGVAVVFAGPFDAEEIGPRLGLCLV